jgi:hypothetical protein
MVIKHFLAACQTVLLHCMIYGKILVGVESWLRCLSCLLSLLCWSELHNPLLPSYNVPEVCAVCQSTSVQLGLPLFRVISIRTFPTKPVTTLLGNSRWDKVEVLLTACSCCTDYCAYIPVSFSCHFFKQSYTKNSIKNSCVEIGSCPFRGGF